MEPPMEPTQFSLDEFVDLPCDQDSQMLSSSSFGMPSNEDHILGLDEWKIPETLFPKDGSSISLWELARANGLHFEGEDDKSDSALEDAFLQFGVDPVIGPATLDHLELGDDSSNPIFVDDVAPKLSTSAKQSSTVYPLDTLCSLENVDLGPPLAFVQLSSATGGPVTQQTQAIIDPAVQVAPVTAAPVTAAHVTAAPATRVAAVTQFATKLTQRASVIIDPAVQVTPATDALVIQATHSVSDITNIAPVPQHALTIIDQASPATSSSATGTVKVFEWSQGNPGPQPKQPRKKMAKRVPKSKQDDALHKKQKVTKVQSTPRKAKGKTTLASVTPSQKIAPAPMTPMTRFSTPMTPVTTSMTPVTAAYPSQQKQLEIQEHLRNQENYLRVEWDQLLQQRAHFERQPSGDQQQLQIYKQQRQLHEQQYQLCMDKIMNHKAQVRQYRDQRQHQMQQTQPFQTAAAQQVQQPTQQMQGVYHTPPNTNKRMQSAMQQTQQLQATATQQVQPIHQMQGVYQEQGFFPTPPNTNERMRSLMQQTQQLQSGVAHQVQQPTYQMPAVHHTPSKERMQSVMRQSQLLQDSVAQQVQQPTYQTQAVQHTPSKVRMQSAMRQTQQLQASAAQRVQRPTQQMQGPYYIPTQEHMQSVSSLSAASPKKRTFEFAENIVPTNFVANPNNHARWTVSPNGDRTYLNGPQAKKARVSNK